MVGDVDGDVVVGLGPDQFNNAVPLASSTSMVGEKGSQLMEGFEIQEPLMAREAAADRQVVVAKLLEGFRQHLQERTDHFLGYPSNLGFDYSPLTQFLRFSLNNFGDPFVEINYGVNSRQFEVAVLDWFTRLWDLQKGEHWGYITSGGSEGNMYGLLVGRELFPDGILYASRESHYSILKVARMYRIEYVKIDALVSGEMNYADFKSKLLQNSGRPAIVNVTIGTTMKGAVDDLDKIIETLENCGFRDRFYIHCDGALSGPMMPFVKQAPKVTFKKPIGSISISGHKFIGCPMPCGVVITRLAHAKLLSTNIEYIASRDATITGSRNGHAPIYLWYALNKKGYRGIREDVQRCQENAHFLVDRLKEAGVSAYWNALSNTVVFERPNDETFVRKWQIACEGKIAHVVVMPHITAEKLDKFVEELRERRVCWHQDVVPCVAADIGRENCFCDLHNKNPRIGKSFTNDRGTFSNFMMHG